MISTIREWLEGILGTYEPVMYTVKGAVSYGGADSMAYHEYTYQKVADGLAGLDWSYIFTALLLLVVIYSVFRLLGILLQAFTGGRY